MEQLTALLAVFRHWLQLPRFPVTLTGDTAGFSLAFGGAGVADGERFLQTLLIWASGKHFCPGNKLLPAAAAGASK